MRENVKITHLYLNIIFTGTCEPNILGFPAVPSVLLAVGISTTLWFRSLDTQELGMRGSFATLIYKEVACLVRPEHTSPCSLRSDEMLLPQTRSWVYEICCLCPACCHRMCKAVKMSSIQPSPEGQNQFFSPFWFGA